MTLIIRWYVELIKWHWQNDNANGTHLTNKIAQTFLPCNWWDVACVLYFENLIMCCGILDRMSRHFVVFLSLRVVHRCALTKNRTISDFEICWAMCSHRCVIRRWKHIGVSLLSSFKNKNKLTFTLVAKLKTRSRAHTNKPFTPDINLTKELLNCQPHFLCNGLWINLMDATAASAKTTVCNQFTLDCRILFLYVCLFVCFHSLSTLFLDIPAPCQFFCCNFLSDAHYQQ